MSKSPFLHISPDPTSRDDLIPVVPFWQVHDILLGTRYVLRRRTANEVRERAVIILNMIRQYEEALVDTAHQIGEPVPTYPDDAALLQDIMVPNRVFPLRQPAKREGIDAPVVAEEGWVEAEDFAVLGLLKVDQAIDALQDETPQDIIVSAGVLLEAYRCLLLAERVRGRDILTPEEFDDFRERYNANKKDKITEQNSQAVKGRKTEILRLRILDLYRNMRRDRPSEDSKVLAREIAKAYLDSYPDLPERDRILSPTNAYRTVRDWIKKEDTLSQSKQSPAPFNEARKEPRKKHQF